MKSSGGIYIWTTAGALYFTADGRIDFRELVKDLAGILRRDRASSGSPGRDENPGRHGDLRTPALLPRILREFVPVSIKMAKEQNLSLNPTKISGTCGRLMCCLKNEADTYAYLNKGMPGKGDQLTTPDGKHGEVQSVNILRQTVKAVVDMEMTRKSCRSLMSRILPLSRIRGSRRHLRTSRRLPIKRQRASTGTSRKKANAGINRIEANAGTNRIRTRGQAENKRRLRGQAGSERTRDKPGRGDYGDRQDRSERGDKPGRGDYGDRQDRSERGDRPGRGDYGPVGEAKER